MIKKKLSVWAKENNICYMTAFRMHQSGKINTIKLPTGTILVVEDDKQNNIENKVILYARVSSSENKSNLESQLERLRMYSIAKGYKIIKEVKEVGSGLNDNRKQLLSILNDKNYNKIIVEHKDRFCRFGINFIQEILKQQNKEIEIINDVNNDKEDLMQDFVSIITSFTARLYGLRRSKRKTEKIIQELKENEISRET